MKSSTCSVPVVYLDTQDYSRFGDVLRGKSDAKTEALFTALETRRQAGNVIFAISMPLLSELLQYDVGFRETTLRKAEAIERLCGSWALAYPSRLIAAQIADAAIQRGVIPARENPAILSAERYWYPNIADVFRGMRARMRQTIDAKIAEVSAYSRALRRRAARQFRNLDVADVARISAPEIAAEFGLPVQAVVGSVVALLRDQITPEQASRRLFAAIAEPVKFVETYFEKVNSDRSLPTWMSKAGSEFQGHFLKLRDQLRPLMSVPSARQQLQTMLTENTPGFGRTILRQGLGDTAEFGVDEALGDRLIGDPIFTTTLPTCEIVGGVLSGYIWQIMGMAGSEAKVEHSFAGDLFNALYLPYVDLWRGDRRFSPVLKSAVPRYGNRVIEDLTELPAAIDAWHEAASHP